ncbi:MAG: Hsp70 family protein, partial [Chitinophagaceae bacterium]
MMKPVNFGIDLGTTNSLIARYDGSKIQLFKNPIGQKEMLASVVAYRPERILVGDKAREYLTKDPINVFGNFKRKMGTDEKYYVVNIDDNVTPVQLSSLILKELKTFIHTGEIPEACVITIPASFDTMQSNATLKAGQEAGFKDVFLLQEPIAASLAFFN